MAQKLPIDLREQTRILTHDWTRQIADHPQAALLVRSMLLGMQRRLSERAGTAKRFLVGEVPPEYHASVDRDAFLQGRQFADRVIFRGGKGQHYSSTSSAARG
jgi:hypothetical protein